MEVMPGVGDRESRVRAGWLGNKNGWLGGQDQKEILGTSEWRALLVITVSPS